jgi:CoA:oxalate CoA-transferase
MCDVLDRPAMATDPRFKSSLTRGKNKEVFEEALLEALSHKPMREWVQLLQAVGVPCGPVNDMQGAMDEPQLQHRRMLVKSEDGYNIIGNPVKISGYDDPLVVPALDKAKTDIRTILAKL